VITVAELELTVVAVQVEQAAVQIVAADQVLTVAVETPVVVSDRKSN
jgi:hypothetical protein